MTGQQPGAADPTTAERRLLARNSEAWAEVARLRAELADCRAAGDALARELDGACWFSGVDALEAWRSGTADPTTVQDDTTAPHPNSLEALRRRAGHCNGRPCNPACGYCNATRQCERCEAIAAQLRAEHQRDTAIAERDHLRALLSAGQQDGGHHG